MSADRADPASALEPAVGRLLVATPELADPNFAHTVVYLLAVREEGVLGVVLNRPSETRVDEVMPRWTDAVREPSVMFFGGPVGLDSVIGLTGSGSVDLSSEPDEAFAADRSLRLFAGSAGWGSEQLGDEIAEGSWWVFESEIDDVLTTDPSGLWSAVLRRQGGRTAWFALATANPMLN